jgi:ABC-type phosphate transport system substrate-binding protein
MLPNQKSSALGFALLLTTVATAKPIESIFVPQTLAQAAPTSFPFPSSVPTGTTIQIDGSSSMVTINQALKQRFEQQFSGSRVNLNYSGTPAGLQALRDGKIDLAAIGRPLTAAERQEGLIPVTLERGKIAIITSPENPFKGGITVVQLVKIVRGEITDWSELGGAPGKIRFVDRPDLSDTRAAFRNYSVFIQPSDPVGSTPIRTPEDSTRAVAQQLGKDGISFAPANQVLGNPSVRIVPMHNTLPTDPRYPFSQPFYYIHKAAPSPGAAALLGYITSDTGRKLVQTTESDPASLALDPATLFAAGTATTVASLNTGSTGNIGAGSGSSPTPSPAGAASPNATSGTAPDGQAPAASANGQAIVGQAPAASANGQTIVGQAPAPNPNAQTTNAQATPNNDSGIPGWLWWLLPLGLGALLLGWLLRSRRSTPSSAEVPPAAPSPSTAPTTPPPPPPLMTPSEPGSSLASRAESVISSDRAAIAEVQSPTIPTAAIGGAAVIAGAGAVAASQLGRADAGDISEPTPQSTNEVEPPVDAESAAAALPLEDVEVGDISESTAETSETSESEVEPPAVVPERPLVEIREMPPVEMTAPSIEPPEAPPESDFNLPGAAALGVAGLGAAGAAAWMNRTRSGDSTEPEPLATLDEIEDLDEPEDAMLDQPAIELNLDDAPSVDEAVPQPSYEQLAFEQGVAPIEATDATETLAENANNSQGVIPGIAALGGAAALGAAGVGQAGERFSVSDPEPQLEEAIEPEVMDETPAIVESSDLEIIEAEPLPDDEAQAIMDNSEAQVIEFEEPPIIAATSEVEPVDTSSSLPDIAALGGAAVLGAAGLAGIAGSRLADQGANLESSQPEVPDTQEAPAMIDPNQPDANAASSDESTDESVLPGIAAVGGIAAGAVGMAMARSDEGQTIVESARFDVGQTDLSSEALADVDEGLPDLPEGYGDSRIVLMPRDPQWAYAYWDIPNEHKSELRNQGGQNLVLRLYDVTDVDLAHQSPHSLQQFACDEMARDWYLPIPVSDRDYIAEIGYVSGDGRWLMLARSQSVRIPPAYPSAWDNDQFATIDWDEELTGKTFLTLGSPTVESETGSPNGMYDQIFDLSQGAELQRMAGSIFGSMQQVPTAAVSSFVFPSGMGMWALPTVSGMSGIGMSGVGMFSGGAIPARPRKFWLVADAELIIYGATEPDAMVSIGGQIIPLNPDGTFRFQMSFQDGLIDYPILAVAKDGEQTRSIHLKFNRETPSRNTNTKDEAVDEWQ